MICGASLSWKHCWLPLSLGGHLFLVSYYCLSVGSEFCTLLQNAFFKMIGKFVQKTCPLCLIVMISFSPFVDTWFAGLFLHRSDLFQLALNNDKYGHFGDTVKFMMPMKNWDHPWLRTMFAGFVIMSRLPR